MKQSVKRFSSNRGFTALILVFALVIALALPAIHANAEDNGAVGIDVSGFSTVDIYGNEVNGDIFKSRDITVIHYFAIWYDVCIVEMGYIQTAHENFSESEVGVYGLLEASSSADICASLMDAYAYTYPCLMLDDVLSEMAGVYPMVPQTFFVDSNGIVVEHFAGIFETYEQLEAIIASHVGQSLVYHTVAFIDGLTDEVIASVPVVDGDAAEAPEPPVHEGYSFSHWDADFSCVHEDINVVAVYIVDVSQYELGDVNMDGNVDITDVVLLLRGVLGIETSDGVSLLGDMDTNGEIQVDDVVILIRKVLGISA